MPVETIAQARSRACEHLPAIDVDVLLANCLGRNRAWLIAHADDTFNAELFQKFQGQIARRVQGEPVAYITGQHEFWSLSLAITPDVLDPRPDTEILVEAALKKMGPCFAGAIADMGTGSGAIALALASEHPTATVYATDINPAALQLANVNASNLGLTNLYFRQGHWFTAFAKEPKALKFDAIVSNPPYIADDDVALQSLTAEPRQALVSAENGLADINHLISQAPSFLKPGGWLMLEHGSTQASVIRQRLIDERYRQISTIPDLAGLDRVTIAQAPPIDVTNPAARRGTRP